MSRPLRVLLADDHTVMRDGVRTALEERGFTVVAETGNANDAVSAALEHVPDVCLLDLYMPGNGIVAARRIKDALPWSAVVMLTVSEADDDLLDALRAGADGYLLKTIAADRLAAALMGVLRGEAALPRKLTGRVVSEFHASTRRRLPSSLRGGRSGIVAQLSPRELEVLALLLENMTTSAIAMRLGISDVTVRRHVSSIVRVSGMPDRRSAIEALRDRLETSVRWSGDEPQDEETGER
jgi:two-component system, NarL family, nitrate/nitrite response regulator NarL